MRVLASASLTLMFGDFAMQNAQIVRCPNCGSLAKRQLLGDRPVAANELVLQTACPVCDYLMVMSWPTGRVIEAYAPGQSSYHMPTSFKPRLFAHAQ